VLFRSIQEVLRSAETASRYASSLSLKLLTFAEGGSPVKKVTSISRVLEESIGLSLSGSNIACESVLQDGLHHVEIDEGQVIQVFNNLLINAKEAMPEGGRVRVNVINIDVGENGRRLLDQGDYIRISIADDGVGIPEENLGKIFDPFFTVSSVGKGTGLGLSICYSIVKQHLGDIEVQSEEGKGTTFTIRLPRL